MYRGKMGSSAPRRNCGERHDAILPEWTHGVTRVDDGSLQPHKERVKKRNGACQFPLRLVRRPLTEIAMRKLKWMALVPAVVFAAACGRNGSPAVDDALKQDLALASQAQPYNPQQFVSPTEAGLAAQGYAPQNLQTVARAPVAATPVRRTSTARRSSGSSRSSGGYYPAPAPTRTVKHTGRDAAIGAGAGAVIGAIASRDKVKGGLIGAAAGGILGAVIGNNVDIQKKVPW